jgi:cysteine-rich repeat protein
MGQPCKANCTNNVCGDNDKGANEACDDGNVVDGDGCSAMCAVEVCGDGVTQAPEECDDGNMVNDDACTNMCKAAKCGDMIVQGPEECDDGNMNDADACNNQCHLASKRVFVTSMEYNGNLGGIAGADAKCQGLAMGAGLPGMYMAWVTDGNNNTTAPASRFLTKAAVPYLLPDGTKVADNWADLIDGSLDAPINRTETGAQANGEASVWTDTGPNGSSAGMVDCTSWTATNQSGTYGDMSATNGSWTNTGNTTGCTNTLRIYCFQQ